MPEAATPEEIEKVYMEGWRLGLKAIAIYRDNSKRSQPLMTSKKKDAAEAVVTTVAAEPKAYRRRLPVERQAITHKFDVAGHEGYITVGLYDDGQPGEIFLKMAKEGSTISGLMDTFATTVSVALQYGVPLKDLVHKFAHVRFEPSGFTSNPEIPIAKSIVDYIFRWMGSRFLGPEERATLGLIDRSNTSESSIKPLTLGFGTDPAESAPVTALASTEAATDAPTEAARAQAPANGNGHSNGASGRVTLGSLGLGVGQNQVTFAAQADAPSCADCGSIMVRNGSCYKCLNCGSTSGCS
jgi:ribonucleoside-diphosphate reductase alpha chain